MKNLIRKVGALIARVSRPVGTVGATLILFALPVLSHAQAMNAVGIVFDKFLRGDPAYGAVGAINTDIALMVRYVGTQPSGTVQVTGNNAILFKSGASGAEVADTSMQCGATPGTFDLTQATCNTLGGVVDIANATTTWRIVILDGFRTDTSNGNLSNLAATPASLITGVNINWLTTATFYSTIALTPYRDISAYLTPSPIKSSTFPGGAVVIVNPFIGQRAVLYYANATSTYGSGTSNFNVYAVAVKEAGGPIYNVGPNQSAKGSEVVTLMYSVPAGATTVNAAFSQFQNFGIWGPRNQKLVVRLTNSAAMTAVQFYAWAYSFFFR